ncbi:MAG: hypothetical protein ACRDWH_09710 [Acidimicrobiia bacterium]
MAGKPLDIAEEASPRRVFVWAVDWPGWCRSGRNAEAAIEALAAAASRYRIIAEAAGLRFPAADPTRFDTVDSVAGGGGTDFGVPSVIIDSDRRPVTRSQAVKMAALVEAAWLVFDGVGATAPAELRKGPRGGGRDTTEIIDHVNEADQAYAREIGINPADRAGIRATRASMLEVLRRPSDGTPMAGRKWTQRYAARRIAWHAIDHTWEIEDRGQ